MLAAVLNGKLGDAGPQMLHSRLRGQTRARAAPNRPS